MSSLLIMPPQARRVLAQAALKALGCWSFALLLPGIVLGTALVVQNWLGVLISAPIVGMILWALIRDARRGLSLRVVPRFYPPLSVPTKTYFSGQELLRQFQHIEACAQDAGVLPLAAYLASDVWEDPREGAETICALQASSRDALGAELDLLAGALALAEAEGALFRLEIVAGDGMNGVLWSRLREQGYG